MLEQRIVILAFDLTIDSEALVLCLKDSCYMKMCKCYKLERKLHVCLVASCYCTVCLSPKNNTWFMPKWQHHYSCQWCNFSVILSQILWTPALNSFAWYTTISSNFTSIHLLSNFNLIKVVVTVTFVCYFLIFVKCHKDG